MTGPEDRYMAHILPEGYVGKPFPRQEFKIDSPRPTGYKIVPLWWPAVKLTRWQRFKLWLRKAWR